MGDFMKNLLRLLFGLFVCLHFSGCASIVGGLMKSSPAVNKIYIHNDPQLGDFAIYFSEGSTGREYAPSSNMSSHSTADGAIQIVKITHKTDSQLTVESLTLPFKNGAYNPDVGAMDLEYVTDYAGNVISSNYIDAKGVRTPKKIITSKDKEYVSYDMKALPKFGAIDFFGNPFVCGEYKQTVGDSEYLQTTIDFLDLTGNTKFLKIQGGKGVRMKMTNSIIYSTQSAFLYASGNNTDNPDLLSQLLSATASFNLNMTK